VDVRVDEAGQDQLAAAVDDGRAGGQRRKRRRGVAGGNDVTAFDDEQAVGEVRVRRLTGDWPD